MRGVLQPSTEVHMDREVREERKTTEGYQEKQMRGFLSGYTFWQLATALLENKSRY